MTVRVTAYVQDMALDDSNGVDLTMVPSGATASGMRVSLTPLFGSLEQGRTASETSTVKNRLYSATVHWNLGGSALTSATSYGTYSGEQIADTTAVLGTPQRSDLRLHKLTRELRLASTGARHLSWLLGVFYTHETARLHQTLIPTRTSPRAEFVQLNSIYREIAGFGDVTYRFSRAFDLSVGARWARNRQSSLEFGLASATGRSSEGVFAYSLAPHWHVSRDTLMYLRAATGYQPGGPNALPPNRPADVPATCQPDTLTDYELGVMTLQVDERLSLDADVFHIEWRKIQLITIVGDYGVDGNSGSALSRAFDRQVTWLPIYRLTVRLGGACADARLTPNTSPVLVGARAGARLPSIRRWSGLLAADYT